MNAKVYDRIEAYMREGMASDTAHDAEHVYRVLYGALTIAETEAGVDYDCLVAACLLHDIGRKKQMEDSAVCHAEAGAWMAEMFLVDIGCSKEFAGRVAACIRTHRFRKGNPPASLEAKILFDADKLDVTGALGVARTLAYKGQCGGPLYSLRPDGSVSSGENDAEDTFFREYQCKLSGIYDRFYTAAGRKMALTRKQAAGDFYRAMYNEATLLTSQGHTLLEKRGFGLLKK